MSESVDTPLSFSALGLADPLLKALQEIGYETPTPIQNASIPHLLEGRDLLGMAQTGTGKTAAFALPLLCRIDPTQNQPQLLVLAPTRELAIQVAEAFQTYTRHMKGVHILPIYGGQSYDTQLRQLKRGVQVVVGTPGRVMDHMRRGSLKLDSLRALVLDEADEMLRMGFIDDVNWVLEHTPADRQIALFSATMPREIQKVAQTHLNDPAEIKIKAQTATATTIRQRYWQVSGLHKMDALTRILEMQAFEAMIIFVRTKSATEEVAEKLSARGFAAEALNGDMSQQQRERTITRLKKGQTDILVATDVVARGLDVERISHVLNYDIPYDTESYIHRIGRTGRAGREGEAILFVGYREQRMLRAIERATRQPIERMQLPSTDDINEQRVQRFKDRISETLDNIELEFYQQLLADYQKEHDCDPIRMAAALAALAQGDSPLLLTEPERPKRERTERTDRGERGERRERAPRKPRPEDSRPRPLKDNPEVVMERYSVAVGYEHGVKPGNLVGAIANEANLESKFIGHIEIYDRQSTIDLPAGMPQETLQMLQKIRVCGQRLHLQALNTNDGQRPAAARKPKGGRSKRPAGK
ncbi:DEAD/DEAH box helicase [Marinobacterium arenosum]|uniref:DEAD/DEAH box helicase n=1 Tax=Marinobacterium arenosum TaxID=2862496 RepID=UPI001C987FEA|nr:DEAD/DEAH box helicase [Marinobacterium arenosum]MBY4677690.1 DEAD/DEAH box helicase [Marinobacterium arenosum]